MKVYVYHNEHPDHWSGWRPEHAGHLELKAVHDSEALGRDETDVHVLAALFYHENHLTPADDRRSFSVGDVALLENAAGQQRAYACAPAGWDRLPDHAVQVVHL